MSGSGATGIRVEALRVAAGDGRLARRDDAVLFLPAWADGADDLLDAFTTAPDGEVVDAVTTAVVDHDFAVPPFACLAWSSVLALVVFGDLAVETDHPAVPLLSGAGSRTWVEHTLRRAEDVVTVTVQPPEDEPPTDLAAGVVPAAGFALALVAASPASSRGPAGTDAPPVPAPVPDHVPDPTPESTPDPAPQPEPAPEAEAAEEAAPEPEPVPAPAPAAERTPASDPGHEPGEDADELDLPPAVGTQDLDSLDAIRSAVVGDASGAPPDAPSPSPPPSPAARAGSTVPLDTAAPMGGPALVEASTCPSGHLTPAGSATCRVCGVDIAAGAEVTTVQRPPLGVLRLDDGKMLPLDRTYRIGRRPSGEDGVTPARIEGEKISRTHLEVVLRGWDVLVRDRESTNGTWVASGPDEQFRRVDPEVPVRIEPGAIVRLDQRTLTYDPPEQ